MSGEIAPMDMSDYSGDLDQYINSINKIKSRKSVGNSNAVTTRRENTAQKRSITSSIVSSVKNSYHGTNAPPVITHRRRVNVLDSDDSQNSVVFEDDHYNNNPVNPHNYERFYGTGESDDDDDDDDDIDNDLVLVNDTTGLVNQFKHLKLPGILSTICDVAELLPEDDASKIPGDKKDESSNLQDLSEQYNCGRLKITNVDISISYIEETKSLIDTHVAMGIWHRPDADPNDEYCVEIHFPMGYFDVMETERPKSLELLRLNMSRLTNIPVTIDSIKSSLIPGLQTMVVMPEVISEEQCEQTFVAYNILEWHEMDIFLISQERCESVNGVECSTRKMLIEPRNFSRVLKNKQNNTLNSTATTTTTTTTTTNNNRKSRRDTLLLENVLFIKKICPVYVNGVIPQCFQKFVFTPETIGPSVFLIDVNCDFVRQILPKRLNEILNEVE